jgi:hypothetical protein
VKRLPRSFVIVRARLPERPKHEDTAKRRVEEEVSQFEFQQWGGRRIFDQAACMSPMRQQRSSLSEHRDAERAIDKIHSDTSTGQDILS